MYLTSVSSRLLLHDVETWKLQTSYGCYDGLLKDISWSDDSKYLLQVNPLGVVEILVVSGHNIRSRQHIPLRETWSASFHRDGHRNVAIGTRSGNVLIWDTKKKSVVKSFPTSLQNVSVNHISYDAKNTNFAANLQNGDTIIYGLTQNMPLMTVKLTASKNVNSMKYHHECRATLGFATEEGHLVIRDIVTNTDKAFYKNVHSGPVKDFLFSPSDKDVMYSCGLDKVVKLYDFRCRNVVANIRLPYALTTIAVNNQNQMALGTANGHILIHDIRDISTSNHILSGHNERVNKVVFQPVKHKTIATEIDTAKDHSSVCASPVFKAPHYNKSSDIPLVTEHDRILLLKGLDPSNYQLHHSRTSNVRKELPGKPFGSKNMLNKSNATKVISRQHIKALTQSRSRSSCISDALDDSTEMTYRSFKAKSALCEYVKADLESDSTSEFKKYLKESLSEVAKDNKNNFYNLMTAMSKQKQQFDKQLAAVMNVLQSLLNNQNVLAENVRRLSLELKQIKSQQLVT